MLKRNQQSGFTIIEVVLVIAIAGLIFAAVFIALPQLQESQRDSTRRSDAGRLTAGITEYSSNVNNGLPPSNAAEVTSDVVGRYVDDFDAYTVGDGLSAGNVDLMVYTSGSNCDGDSNNRTFNVQIELEAGDVYCVDG